MEVLIDAQFSCGKHEDLLSAISELEISKQRLASPTRRELSFQVSELDLSHTEKLDAQENTLMKTVWQKQRLGENDALSKTLKFAHQKVKTLNRPLQGPAAARSRRTLAQQLEIGLQLTQKNKMGSSSEGEEEEEEEEEETKKRKDEISWSDDNPWVGIQAVPKEGTVVSNYRKYWQQRNHPVEKSSEGNILNTKVSNYLNDDSKKYAVAAAASGSWIVTPATNMIEGGDDVISNISNQMEQKLTMIAIRKAKNFETSSSLRIGSTATVADSDEETDELPLRSKITAFVDEELNEETQGKNMNKDFRADNTNKLFGVSERKKENVEKYSEHYNVDPNKLIRIKPKYLLTQLPDEVSNGNEKLDDNESDEENQMNITEAFTEDDVVAEFRKEKEEMLEKCLPADIDLTLPGWGEWTGKSTVFKKK